MQLGAPAAPPPALPRAGILIDRVVLLRLLIPAAGILLRFLVLVRRDAVRFRPVGLLRTCCTILEPPAEALHAARGTRDRRGSGSNGQRTGDLLHQRFHLGRGREGLRDLGRDRTLAARQPPTPCRRRERQDQGHPLRSSKEVTAEQQRSGLRSSQPCGILVVVDAPPSSRGRVVTASTRSRLVCWAERVNPGRRVRSGS